MVTRVMGWTLLKIIYPIIMVPYSVSLWFVRTKVNKSYGLDWLDFVNLRVICLTTATFFWILTLIFLIKRHRSFPLLWGGTIIIGGALFVLPAPAVKSSFEGFMQFSLALGLAAHLILFFINDRCLPRTVKVRERPEVAKG